MDQNTFGNQKFVPQTKQKGADTPKKVELNQELTTQEEVMQNCIELAKHQEQMPFDPLDDESSTGIGSR